MSGGRWNARQTLRRKRNRARLENAAIVVLAVIALLLAGRTGMLQNTLPALGGGQTVEGGYSVGPAIALTGQPPVRLMLQTREGRFGVEYDQGAVDRLCGQGMTELLDHSLRAMEPPASISEEVWQQALTGGEGWAFYDYLDNILFNQQDRTGAGAGRFFLVTVRGGQADSVLFYNENERAFFSGKVRESVPFPAAAEEEAPNGARFAFEDQSVAQTLSPYMMVLNDPPICPVYAASDPILDLDGAGWEELLERLDFNVKAVSPYNTATGSVIREGADTLRVLNDGTLQYHNSENGEFRYQALSGRERDLQSKAEEILDRATAPVRGPARFYCRSIRTLGDGQIELVFHYLLDGARVQMWGEGWAARFLFRDNGVTAYTILMRSYEATAQTAPLMPARQAAAAASAMGRRGAELQVAYQDMGEALVSASWTVREPR